MSAAIPRDPDADRKPPAHLHHDMSEVTRVFWEYYNDWRPVTLGPDGPDYENPRFVDNDPDDYGVLLMNRETIIDHCVPIETAYLKVQVRDGESTWISLVEYMDREPAKCFFYVLSHNLLYEDRAWFTVLPAYVYLYREDEDSDSDSDEEFIISLTSRDRIRYRRSVERDARAERRRNRREGNNGASGNYFYI